MSTQTHAGGRLTAWLEKAPAPAFAAYAIAAAFTTYFCMYAFRKPFAAAKFEGEYFLGSAVALKTAIVISQIFGYALSKYIGIKVCSEVSPARRAVTLVTLIIWAQLALVAYGLVPNSLKTVAIFMNGLPLGMVWGLVVWYLEGRRTSELLLAGLSCSYIVSSGIVKDIGRAMMEGGAADWWRHVPLIGGPIGSAMGKVNEGWMPAITGLHFLPLFGLAVWMLNQLPGPSESDVAARSERKPMAAADRLAFARQFILGISLLCVSYFFLTAYRDFRDNYLVEIFDGLGYPYAQNKAIISRTETLVAFGVMIALALLTFIKDNRRALVGVFLIMTSGILLLGVSTVLLDAGLITGFWWMTLTGLGCSTSSSSGFKVTRATPQPFHVGTVCMGGTICQAQVVDRRLGDYFTIDTDTNGNLVAAYSDTRQGGSVALPAFFRQTGGTSFSSVRPTKSRTK